MNYKEVEELLKSTESLEELLTSYKEVFDKVDHYKNLLQEGCIDNKQLTDEAMKTLTSLFMSLNTVVSLIDVEGLENYFMTELKKEADKKNKDFQISLLKAEARNACRSFNRVRAIFNSYRENCDKAISILQSSLKYQDKEA